MKRMIAIILAMAAISGCDHDEIEVVSSEGSGGTSSSSSLLDPSLKWSAF